MSNDQFILNGHIPERVDDLLTWGRWMEKADRHVALTQVSDGVKVSTVFLGLDHSFGSGGPPIVFETMIFGGPHDQWQDRYATWDEAVAGHAKAVALARAAVPATEGAS